MQPTATQLQKKSKTETRKAFDNLIIRLFVYRVHGALTAAGSSRHFTTGNSCNVCHMCRRHQQSRKLLRSDLHLPQDRVYFLCKTAERSGHYPALRTSDKRTWIVEMGPLAVQAIVGLGEHAEYCSHSLSQQPGMQRLFSPVKPHLVCLSWTGLTGLLQKGPPSAIHRNMPDGPERKGLLVLGAMLYSTPLFRYNTRQKKSKAWLQTSQWAGVSSNLTQV